MSNNRSQPVLDPSIQRSLTHFSLLTHGFGSPAIVAALHSVMLYINESLKFLEKQINTFQNSSAVNFLDMKKEIEIGNKK